ncbi:MAG: methyl-accepting chemotaxis protein [Planctomycetota bacterium]
MFTTVRPAAKKRPAETPTVSDWEHMFDSVRANLMVADAELNIVYANPAAMETLNAIAPQLREAFGVSVSDLLGASIHRFHKDPKRIERILENPASLPHVAEFTFGEVTLAAKIDAVRGDAGKATHYVVSWEDISEKAANEEAATRLSNMVENLPINVIYADRDNVIRYMNPASTNTLRKLQHLLPIPVDTIVGSSIDTFHSNPAHQQKVLADPSNLPIHRDITLGDEILDLLVSAIYDKDQNYVGAMATWSIVTEQAKIKADAGQLGEVGQTVASSVTEMAAAIEEVSKSVSRTASLATGAEQQASDAGDSIEQLNAASVEIEEVVSLIRDLADQTNLLALNATIEAARAGESGRSFAVVAKEVKELAAETTGATQNIGERVDRIRSNISTVVDATKAITESVTEVSQNSNTIAAAIEEQSATMSDMQGTAMSLLDLSGKLQKI